MAALRVRNPAAAYGFGISEAIILSPITRISIQTVGSAFGGTGLCSYRVRGVDGSCAKHLTVESYRVVLLLAVILIIINFASPTHSFIPCLKPSFSANPSHHSLSFSSSGLTTWIPQTVYCYF